MINQATRQLTNNLKFLIVKKLFPYYSLSSVCLPHHPFECHAQQIFPPFVRWNSDVAGLKISTPVEDAIVPKNLDVAVHSTSGSSSLTSTTKHEVQVNSTHEDTAVSTQVHKMSALERLKRLDEILPKVSESFNLTTFVNRSPVLQQLVKLGVNVSEYDKDVEKACYVLLLDFETDVKPYLFFLHHLEVPAERWGRILTKNPYILKEDLDVLHTRVRYLRSKKFSLLDISTLASYPKWLSHSIESIDSKLGFLQRLFGLTGDEVRAVATRLPRIVFSDQMTIREVRHLMMDEFGLTRAQVKQLLLDNPCIFHLCKHQTKTKMKLIVNKMKIPLEMLIKCNKLLSCRLHKLDNRHYFLKSLGRAQYDPKLPHYVSPESFAVVPDDVFATELAQSSLEAYYLFLKTL